MPKSDVRDRLTNAVTNFLSAVGAACIAAILLSAYMSRTRGEFLFTSAICIGLVLWVAYSYAPRRGTDPTKHLFVQHIASGEWGYFPPRKHPFIPTIGRWVVQYPDCEWKMVTQEVRLFQEGRATVTLVWRPDPERLDLWMEGDQDAMVERLRRACADFAVRRYESVEHAFDKAGRESLVGQPVQLDYGDVVRGTGLELGSLSMTVTKLPEPQPAPEPHEPWEAYEELHIGDRGTVPVFLDDEDRITHVQIIGASRFGKSKLVEYAVRQLVGKQGVVVMDPNEQLYADLVVWGAHRRRYGLLLLDPSDERNGIGFNPFSLRGEKTPARIAARASRLLKTALRAGKFQGGDAPLAERIMRVLFYILIEQDLPVTDLQAFMTPRLFERRDAVMERCASEDIRDEWTMLTAGKKDNAYVAMMQSSATRLVSLFMEPGVRRILTNRVQLDIPSIVEEGATLLVNLKDTPDVVSAEARNIIGTFLVDEVWSAIKRRSKEQAERLPGMNLVIDEFHNFATPEFAMMLKEGGKYGLHMWLINHALDDLDRDVQNALRACHTRIAFGGTSRKDAATVLEGSTPGPDRSLHDEIERIPGMSKRQFALRRTAKRNVGCTTPEVRAFPVSPEKLREYTEIITRAPKEEPRFPGGAEPEAIAESQAVVQNDSQEPAKPSPPQATAPPNQPGEIEPDDFYY